MCHANSNRFLKLYPLIDGNVPEPHVCENTMKFEACLPCLSFSILSLYQSSLGGSSVRPSKAQWNEISSEWGCVGCKPTPAVLQFIVAKGSEAPFWKHLQNSHWLVAKLLVAKHSIPTPKVSSFFGTISYILQTLKGVLQIVNISNPTCCARRWHCRVNTHTEASAHEIQAVVSVSCFL